MKSSKDWNWKFADKDSASLAETILAAGFSITFGWSTETYLFNLHIRDLSHSDNQDITSKYAVCYWMPHDSTVNWIDSIGDAKTQKDVFESIDITVAGILSQLASGLSRRAGQ